jgi:hypothetical protein
MASTSAFGWETPDDTDLVKDGAAAIRTLGNSIDTSMSELKGGTTGQVLSKTSNTDMDFTWVAQDDSNAIQNAIVDAKGDLIGATAADTPARLAVGTNGQVLTADSTAATGLAWATPSGGTNQFYAGKNKVINGDFSINQRNFTSNTSNGVYNFDRWFQGNGGGTYTTTPQTFTPGAAPVAGYEGKTFLQAITASQSASSDFANISQKIESVRTFAGQNVVVSFWAKANTGTPKVGLSMQQGFGSGGSPSAATRTAGNATVTLSTSWARYSITVSVPSISGKTLGTTEDSFLSVQLWQSIGSDYTTGFPSGIGLQNFTLSLWGVQVEAGSTATDFQTATATIQGELAACQRYYFRNGGLSAYTALGGGTAENSTRVEIQVATPVTMRTLPTAVDYSTIAVQPYGTGTITAVTSAVLGTVKGLNPLNVELNVASGLTQGVWYRGLTNNSTSGYLGFSAEL